MKTVWEKCLQEHSILDGIIQKLSDAHVKDISTRTTTESNERGNSCRDAIQMTPAIAYEKT